MYAHIFTIFESMKICYLEYKKLLKIGIIVGLLLFIVIQCFAISLRKGKANIEDEHIKFIQNLSLRLQNYKNDYTVDFYNRFNSFWLSPELTNEDRKSISKISTLIDEKRYSIVPFLTSYLESVMAFYEESTNVKGFETWNNSLPKLLNKKGIQSQYVLFAMESPSILNDQNALYRGSTIRWQVDTATFTYQYDTTLFVRIKNTNLKCYTSIDSFAINKTSGIYFPFRQLFKGSGGIIYWKNAGYDSSKVFATAHKYTVDLTRQQQNLDSCKFSFEGITHTPLLGTVTLSTDNISNPTKTGFPQFSSYSKQVAIKNLFDSVNFKGGISIKGNLLLGYGTKINPATLAIIKGKKPFLTASSTAFQLEKNRILANKASIRIQLVNDSIVHANKNFFFDNIKREVRITTDLDNMLTKAPFLDSYHQLGIYSDQLYWNLNQNTLRFNTPIGGAGSDAIFESMNFFNQDMFDGLQRRDDKHPIYSIRRYERSLPKGSQLTCDGLSRFIRYSNADVDIILKEMAFLGYLVYDEESKVFTINKKMYDALKSRSGSLDFDAILFRSEAQKNRDNAILDLGNFNLKIYGIPEINLSDTQNVKVYPRYNSVLIKKNRDMEFDGFLIAGLVSFNGEGFQFNYEQFNVNIDKVVSMNFEYKADSLDATGQRALNAITSTIEKIQGVLQIDDPNNKSGIKRNPKYPKFKSITDSYIFYDNPENNRGVYKRNNFYFRLYPYELDSLNNFERKNLDFKGELVSADIFAPFEHTITVQPDQSFGFTRKLDSAGIATYKGKGQFYNSINLSNRGLAGNGHLKYINSTSYADLFLFFPDTCLANISKVNFERRMQGVEYPNGWSKAHLMRWFPNQNFMNFYKSADDFILYDNQVTLNGNVKLEPLGISGNGTLMVDLANLKSSLFNFSGYTFSSPAALITISDSSKQKLRFMADSVATHIDLISYKGKISKSDQPFALRLPSLEYLAYAKQVGWNMKAQHLTVESSGKLTSHMAALPHLKLIYEEGMPSGSIFVSTKTDQDSLCFASTSAFYDMAADKLNAYKVPHMLLGDAAAILNPNHDTVRLSTGAKMGQLIKTDIYANRDQKMLHFYDANLNIGGRNGFLGNGKYTYTDMYGTQDTISFGTITLDKQYKTVGFATIPEEDGFNLSPYFKFKGKATATSSNKHLEFDGGFMVNHSYSNLARNWMRFKANINPDSVLIPMNLPYKALNNVRVYAGTHLRCDTVSLYPAFFSGRKYTLDTALVQPEGYLYYNDKGHFYQLSSLDKIRNANAQGNMISLYTEDDINLMVNEGKLNLGVKLSEVQMTFAGKSMQKITDKSFIANGIVALDFHFNQEALSEMTNEIAPLPLAPIDLSTVSNKLALKELVGPDISYAVLAGASKANSAIATPKEFAHTLTLTDITFKWDSKAKSYISNTKFGIANINGKPVNKHVNGFIELFPFEDHRMYVYIDLGNNRYYLFVYTSAGNMFAASSNDTFTTLIDKTSAKKRSVKRGFWNTTYIYTNATDAHINRAKKRFEQLKALEKLSNVK